MRRAIVMGVIVTLASATAAQTVPEQPSKPVPPAADAPGTPATISLRTNGIYNFEAARDTDGIYLQDRRRKWYYAEFDAPCTQLPFAQGIGVKTNQADWLDRFGAIIANGEICPLKSLVHSEGPPWLRRKPKVRT